MQGVYRWKMSMTLPLKSRLPMENRLLKGAAERDGGLPSGLFVELREAAASPARLRFSQEAFILSDHNGNAGESYHLFDDLLHADLDARTYVVRFGVEAFLH